MPNARVIMAAHNEIPKLKSFTRSMSVMLAVGRVNVLKRDLRYVIGMIPLRGGNRGGRPGS